MLHAMWVIKINLLNFNSTSKFVWCQFWHFKLCSSKTPTVLGRIELGLHEWMYVMCQAQRPTSRFGEALECTIKIFFSEVTCVHCSKTSRWSGSSGSLRSQVYLACDSPIFQKNRMKKDPCEGFSYWQLFIDYLANGRIISIQYICVVIATMSSMPCTQNTYLIIHIRICTWSTLAHSYPNEFQKLFANLVEMGNWNRHC